MNEDKLTIYHNPMCSKSRDTLEILKTKEKSPEIIEYLNETPDSQTLRRIISKLGIPATDLVRTGEPAYQDAGLDIETMNEDDIIEAICAHPSLLQRPIVVSGNRAVIGRPPAKVLDII